METKRIPDDLQHLVCSAETAAQFIRDGDTVAFGCFGPAGSPKAVPVELAKTSKRVHFIGGASSAIDDLLLNNMISRTPYQQMPFTRKAIGLGIVDFVEMHLAELTRQLRYTKRKINVAVVESCMIDQYGIAPTTSVGSFFEFLELADRIIVEVNSNQPLWLTQMHTEWPRQPEILKKIVAIVPTNLGDPPRETTIKDYEVGTLIGSHVQDFFMDEIFKGRLDYSLRPLEFGVGTITDAVAHCMAGGPWRGLQVQGEVIMDSVLDMMDAGVVDSAVGTGLYLSKGYTAKLEKYIGRLRLAPVTRTNDAGRIASDETIAINGLISASLAGEGNSSYLNGSIYNGIGGSCEFAQNALISIFVLPSTARGGSVSTIEPRLGHVDHISPNVDVLVTEQGFADLRGVSCARRKVLIMENCVHPSFRKAMSCV